MSFFTTANFVDPKLESEDLSSFLHATQIVEILFALFYIGVIAVVAMSFLAFFDSYVLAASAYFITIIMVLIFFRKTRYFLSNSILNLPVRTRLMIAGNGVVAFLYIVASWAMFQSGVFSAGYCFQFVMPLVAIAVTGSQSSCILFGIIGIATQQLATVLQIFDYQWPNAIFIGPVASDLLIFNAFLCIILSLFVIEISVRFAQSHKLANDVMHNANDHVKKLLEDQVNFIANATHELRTPVMQILGLVDLLDCLNTDPEVKSLIGTLRSATVGTVELVNNVLDYEKMGNGMVKLEQHPFDIRELVKRLLNMSAIQAQSKQIELMAVTSELVPSIIIGDQMRLYQVLLNLMSNAIKFCVPREKPNEVLVTVGCQLTSSNHSKLRLICLIKDTGIGLSSDSIPHLFQAFHQVSSATTRIFGGTGLGLAISRKLARAMKGDISVYSDGPGQGTTFTVNVEVETHPASYEASPKMLPTAFGSVVIFDDVQTALSIMENAIRQIGYQVQTFTSFSEMINFLSTKERIPRLIIADVGIIGWAPGSTPGSKRVELIRSLDAIFGTIPIVALTDQANVLMPSSPYTVYHSKPIIAEQIQSTVLSILSSSIPTSDIEPISRSAITVDTKKTTHLHVLLVDDNLINLKVIGKMIEQMGHHVVVCTNAQSALQILTRDHITADYPGQLQDTTTEDHPIDLIITDFQMPEINGLQLIEKVRRYEQERHASSPMPIILSSGTPVTTIQTKLDSYRMTYFLLKPFSLRELQNLVDKLFASDSFIKSSKDS